MRYFNFSGFNTEEVLRYNIDDRDLHLLSYFYAIQGSDNMEFLNENFKIYYWVKFEKIMEDNPTLYVKKRTLDTMISNLCEKGLLEKIVKCQEGTTFKKTYFRITDKCRNMMFGGNQEEIMVEEKSVNDLLKDVVEQESKIDSNTQEIVAYWNWHKDLIKCSKITDKVLNVIKKRLKQCNIEEIKETIDRYCEVIFDSGYYFNTKWSIYDFFKQENAFPHFQKDGTKWQSYDVWKNGNKEKVVEKEPPTCENSNNDNENWLEDLFK